VSKGFLIAEQQLENEYFHRLIDSSFVVIDTIIGLYLVSY